MKRFTIVNDTGLRFNKNCNYKIEKADLITEIEVGGYAVIEPYHPCEWFFIIENKDDRLVFEVWLGEEKRVVFTEDDEEDGTLILTQFIEETPVKISKESNHLKISLPNEAGSLLLSRDSADVEGWWCLQKMASNTSL